MNVVVITEAPLNAVILNINRVHIELKVPESDISTSCLGIDRGTLAVSTWTNKHE